MRKAAGLAVLLVLALPGRAVDTLTIGTAEHRSVEGGSASDAAAVAVPVFLRDSSGTALDTGTDAQIQGIQFSITFDPAEVFGCTNGTFPNCRVEFEPAGVFAGHNPVIAAVVGKTIHSATFRYEYSRATDPLSFDVDASSPGNLIGYLIISVPQSLTAGTTVGLTVDRTPDKTFLYDGPAEAVTESDGRGLATVNGSIAILSDARSCTPATLSDLSVTYTGDRGCSPLIACRIGEAITFRLDRIGGLAGCETVRWSFGDGKFDVGTVAQHTYASTGSRTVNAVVSTPSNDENLTVPAQVAVTGVPGTCVPVCSATVPGAAQKGVAVNFTGTSTCPGSQYRWEFGDGTTVTVGGEAGTSVVPHVYGQAGVFSWTLTVIAGSQQCPRSGTITVSGRRRAMRSP